MILAVMNAITIPPRAEELESATDTGEVEE